MQTKIATKVMSCLWLYHPSGFADGGCKFRIRDGDLRISEHRPGPWLPQDYGGPDTPGWNEEQQGSEQDKEETQTQILERSLSGITCSCLSIPAPSRKVNMKNDHMGDG